MSSETLFLSVMFSKQMFASCSCWNGPSQRILISELYCAEELQVKCASLPRFLGFSVGERENEINSAHDRITNLVLTARHQVLRKLFYHRSRLSWKPLKSNNKFHVGRFFKLLWFERIFIFITWHLLWPGRNKEGLWENTSSLLPFRSSPKRRESRDEIDIAHDRKK